MGEQFSHNTKGSSASHRKKDAGKRLEFAKAALEKTQKEREQARDYVRLTREIVHHEKYLCEIRGDDQDLIEARKRLQKAKVELKKLDEYCNKLTNQIKHYERVQKKALKRAEKQESEFWSFQDQPDSI